MSAETNAHAAHEEHEEGSIWPAIVGLNTVALIAGLILLLKGIYTTVGLILVFYFIAVVVVFVAFEVRQWQHVISSFFERLQKTPIPAEPEKIGSVGFPTALFLLTEAAFFASAFGAYFLIRSTFPVWPPPGAPHLENFIPRIQTIILLTSSVTIELAVWSAKRGNNRGVLAGILATMVLGIVFMGLKLGIEWPRLIYELGFTPASGFYGSSFYILTGVHGAHVVGGIIVLAIAAGRAKLGHFKPKSHGFLDAVSLYWNFVDLIWLMLFLIIWEGAFLW